MSRKRIPATAAGRNAAKYDPYWLDTILTIEAQAMRLVDPEPARRSSLVSGTVAGDNLNVVEGQANGEGQGIGFDDADLGAVDPGVG